MTDKPYKLDFLQEIVDCHWGGNWLFVQMGAVSPAFLPPFQLRCDFIGSAGGTPGLLSDDGAVSGAVVFPNFAPDQPLTKATINRKLITGGGLELKGVCYNYHNNGQNNPTTACFLVQLSRFQTVSRIRLSRAGDPFSFSNFGITIGTVDDKEVKPGATLPGVPLSDQAVMGLDASEDYLINSSTLEITGPL